MSATIGARLAAVAERQPDAVAFVERDARVTYRQLDADAAALAGRIITASGGTSGRVALFFDRKYPAIASIFGAGHSGATYVLLDAGDPAERLRFILRDSEPVVMLTEAALLAQARDIAPAGCAVVDAEALIGADAASPARLDMPAVQPDATVYLCYTSGSTGQPKGVRQTHENLLFFADAYAKALAIGPADRLSLVYTLSFNAANMDVFGGLLHGATLCAYDLRVDGLPRLAEWLDRQRITVLHAVPTVFRELGKRLAPGRVLPHLRVVDLGGEAVFASDVDLFRGHTAPHCVFVNQLASTEVGLIAQHVVDHRTAPPATPIVPAGRCPAGVRVDILRDDGTPAAAGEAGEMVVCSRHVSPGYWRRPEQDALAFAPDPSTPGGRRYRSGDVGRVDADGNLSFLGRKGSRVKVRGHSVDLTEIEAALAACPGVTKGAALLASGDLQGAPGRLVGYVTTSPGAPRDAALLRRHLTARLPSYMVPAAIAFVDAMPVTASGKVDRNALAALTSVATDAARDVTAPEDDFERAVAAIFGELLALAPVGRDDDFFLQGGDSLLGVELQIRLREQFGVQVAKLHEDATVAGVAARIRAAGTVDRTRRPAMPVMFPLWEHGSAPPLFLVHGRHGQAFVSPQFMRLLGDDQPVWVFQARGLDGLAEPHPTVEAMADDYVAAMRRERPRGPYFIGALCAGAYIAAVMARRLEEAGETVLPLLLLDPPERLLHQGYAQMSEERFVTKMRARNASGRNAGPVDDPAYMQAVIKVAMTFEGAIAAHRPQPYAGSAYVLSSRQRSLGSDGAGLRRIFSGALERFEVGGTHAEALDPNNPVFANYLLRCVERIRAAALAPAPATSLRAPA